MAALSLTPQVFAILSALVEERSGIHYAAADLELFAEKVSGPALEAGFESLLDYYYFLRYDPAGAAGTQALIEALTVHETYFFRELAALQALVSNVLEPGAKERPRRVWCAACASGEEPLTLAMLCDKAGILDRVEIVATDISEAVLRRARAGEFSRRALRSTPPGFLGAYLQQDGERVVVNKRIHARVDWRQVNLLDADKIRALGRFDAIICRNVLIYFRDEVAITVVNSLTAALEPGGRILVGTSESLLRFGSALNCEEIGGSFIYSKVAP